MPLPMLQTSANLSGDPPPSSFQQVPAAIRDGADLAINGGELTGRPSTVVDIASIDSDGSWRVLREGALSEEAVRQALAESRRSG
jgi:tRNA A37 threonylcarbamoyladenosine synthetase subunit TsaC/SUA5/YrdC